MAEDELVDKSLTNKFFKYIRMQSNNKRCADCNNPSPIWTTVTYGFFICTECAAKHRELGVNISKVKSTIMDTWKVFELRRIYVSGNSNVSKLGKVPDTRVKYTNAGWYSKLVDDLSDKSAAEEPGTSFIDNLSLRSEKNLEPQKVMERAMPKFSDAECKYVEERPRPVGAKSSEEGKDSVPKMDKPAVIKQNLFPSLQKSQRDGFNLQNDGSNARKLGFGVLNLSSNSSDASLSNSPSSDQKKP